MEVITKFEDFLTLENQWNAVLEKSQSEHVCLTFEWLRAWWIAFGKNKQLQIFIVKEDNGEIIGIAPLMLVNSRHLLLPARKLSFIYNDNASRADFLITRNREAVLNSIFEYLRKYKTKWDIIELQNISEGSPNFEILGALLIRPEMAFVKKDGLISPFIPITVSWEEYFSSLSKRYRKTLKNTTNRLEKSGDFNIEKITHSNGNKGAFEKIYEISRNSWKAAYKREITNTDENKRFFEGLDHEVGEKGWQNIWLLSVNGKAVAYEYTLVYKNKAYALKADYDEKYSRFSPGTALNMHSMREYFNAHYQELDLCGHKDEYKKRFTSLARNHHYFFIYNNGFYGRLLYLYDAKLVYPLKSFLKRFIREVIK